MEGLHDLGNVAAVCRTAEALGYGAMHLVHEEHMESYKRSRRSSAGAEKWSELHRWTSSQACLSTLKSAGYRILVRFSHPRTATSCPQCSSTLSLSLSLSLSPQLLRI
jgi:tRNA G18 (ribose-2'-O)-methylase SpoU